MAGGIMRARTGTFIFATVCVLAASAALAGPIVRYQQWRTMPDDARLGYVIGGYDALGGVIHGDDPYLEANVRGLAACGPGIGLTPGLMVRMVDVYFDQHPEAQAEFSAAGALHVSLLQICKDYVNAVRSEAQLQLLQ